MERKIGEIFEHKGVWFQCVNYDRLDSCGHCAFLHDTETCWNMEVKGCCEQSRRDDGMKIIFMNLKKIGNPYVYNGTTCQLYRSPIAIYATSSDYKIVRYDMIELEIKQNQEDMEGKKIKLSQKDLTYLISKIRCDILPKHTTYDEITEEIAKMFIPVNDTELSNLENAGKNLKPFDLEAAKAGKPVCTRDGRKVRIICFDAKRKNGKRIIALVPSKDFIGFEDLIDYPDNGNYGGGHENDGDLMMLPEKHEGWVNVYKGGLLDEKSYPTKKEAFDKACPNDYVDTIKIEWEE